MAFWERMEQILNKGLETSKDVLDKARVKAKEMGAKGILRLEIIQYEKEAQQALARLGSKVFEWIEGGKEIQLPGDSQEFAALYKAVQDLKENIDAVEEKLKNS